MLQLSNEYLMKGLDTIEDIIVRFSKPSLNKEEMYTSVLGLYNHFFIWTKYDMTYDLKYCDRASGGFDEDDYTEFNNITLPELLNIIEFNNK